MCVWPLQVHLRGSTALRIDPATGQESCEFNGDGIKMRLFDSSRLDIRSWAAAFQPNCVLGYLELTDNGGSTARFDCHRPTHLIQLAQVVC